ncbi:MAG: SDR family NAD(P)-dependent oxidoreductase, partial [Candidatus Heimdallarchaeota archaeon]|nr:SDR family NAD(P)-dependent oxidoreductase [Candidatus Heimdallarchaeota archaeon]
MKTIEQLKKELNVKYPIWGYSPKGLDDPSLSVAISLKGGIGLVDLEGFTEMKTKKTILRCLKEIPADKQWGVRVAEESQIKWLNDFDFIPIIILASSFRNITKIDKIPQNNWIVAEVNNLPEAQEKSSSVDFFLVKGIESGGKVGEKSSFILIQEFHESGYPFIIQGGFGYYNIVGAFIGGALGVVLEGQLYLLPECPLQDDTKDFLAGLDENDTYLVGESLDYKYRLAGKIANQTIRDLKKLTKEGSDSEQGFNILKTVKELEAKSLYFKDSDIKNTLLPLGVDVCFANFIKTRFGNLSTFLHDLTELMKEQLNSVAKNWPFAENSDFAKSIGVRFPIIQGPMANISDVPMFGKEVLSKGALPIFALGGLLKEEAEEMFQEIQNIFEKEQVFGGGIIGLEVIKERREDHISLLQKYNTPICLLAAGSVQLAKRIQDSGFKTLFHAPALALFKDAMDNKIEYLILEGSECGGHIGNQTSFVLWEKILQFLDDSRTKIDKKVNVIFAGGIADEAGSAMLAGMIGSHLAILSPGIQMGTAYLFTEEIVESKALSQIYQEQLLNSTQTKVIGSTVNTRARAIPTDFVNTTLNIEQERLKQGMPIRERKELYEKDNLGALRIAAKGEIWNNNHVPGGDTTQFVPISTESQLESGCFMAGEIIGRKRNVYRIEDLHFDVIQNGVNFLETQMQNLEQMFISSEELGEEISSTIELVTTNRIAIIGLGCVFPDAFNIDQFWDNILNKKYSITEISKDRWNPKLYFNPDKSIEGKTYSKIGAFIKDYKFNSVKYRIPPKMAEQMDDVQKWSLEAARQALEDAGLPTDGKTRSNIAIIIGNSLGGEIQRYTNRRVFFPEIEEEIKHNDVFLTLSKQEQQEFIQKLTESYAHKYPAVTEDSMPGELSNVIAGRIANVFNLTGKSMITDAACASSIAALDTAINSLKTKEYDIALVGGADRSMDASTYVKFSKIGALSATGSRPFDTTADGFVMGEGAGFIVIKRLEDAIRDGDRIYATIPSIGSSSDGKGKGITAPNPEGQKQAITMALERAELSVDDVQYIEAHGTSTIVGDAVELKVLEEVFKNRNLERKLAVGSIKSQIGHLKSAAGIASIIKTALSLHNHILPPSINVVTLNTKINWKDIPVQINTEVEEWKVKNNEVRRAGISAFGFGGTNYHSIIEEYDKDKIRYLSKTPIKEVDYVQSSKIVGQIEQANEHQICFMYTGQGSQYVGMMEALCNSSEIIAETIEEAEKIWEHYYSINLKEIIFGSPGLTEEANNQRLTNTKFTQPALYVVEIALTKYLAEQGIKPDFVAGHSLGEYSALVASGVLTFKDGLKAVIARGKAMCTAGSNTEGSMAAVLATKHKVKDIVDRVKNHYVTIANINSLSQIVISGEDKGIDEVIELAKEEGITAMKLRVSTAFHSKIVENVEKELSKVLASLEYSQPSIPVFSNVTGNKYPADPDKIQQLLLDQICSSVQWVDEIKEIYKAGARIFVEVGPKRALQSFVKDILKDRKDIQVYTTLNPKEDELEKISKTIQNLASQLIKKQSFSIKEEKASQVQPYFPSIQSSSSDIKQKIDTDHALHDYLRQGYELYSRYMGIETTKEVHSKPVSKDKGLTPMNIGITGVGIGMPGKNKNVFDDSNIDAVLLGENFIDAVAEEIKLELLNKNITKLSKSADGNASFEKITDVSQVINLAGQLGKFDPIEDFGLKPKLVNALDITFQLAICAGLEALKDAGIPLVKSEFTTTTGKVLEGEWALPEDLQDETGIIFASAFPGYDYLIKEVTEHLSTNPEKSFSREFLFRVLSMGHSQFAQLIKAKGPNTQVNAACASTTQAIGIAEDWIKTGRCNRVIVIAADDASSENLLPWIGSGFLVAGGVTTKDKVEEAAIPFGKNRHGLIIGSAAAGLVLENEKSYVRRGVKPIVDLIGTSFTNSAFHGSRLDIKHIKKVFEEFIKNIETKQSITRKEIAKDGMFVSHETYTPARGGSAEAEIESLRQIFGADVADLVIVNTKGFTGHAMGAGIEECVAIKSMEKGIIPPIANIAGIDPNFEDLNFSKGMKKRVKYAIRLAAGFGSQIAFTAFRLNTYEDRYDIDSYDSWLAELGGTIEGFFYDGRVLKLRTDKKQKKKREALRPVKQTKVSTEISAILKDVILVIAEKTGYEPDLIEANMHLEEDLGVDTVKQAEIFGIVRENWELEFDDSVNLSDFSTPSSIAEFIGRNTSKQVEVPEEERQTVVVDSANIQAKVLEIVAMTTGYETDTIESDMDLEEDLGIDTIKQAEIFGELREVFDLPIDDTVNLAELRTINDICEYMTLQTSGAKKEAISIETSETKQVAEKKKSKDEVRVENLITAPIPLDTNNVESINILGRKTLIINLGSKITSTLKKTFETRDIDHTIYELLDEQSKALETNDFDTIIILLPDQKNEPGYVDQVIYEKLFLLFQDLELNSGQLLMGISSESFFGFDKQSLPISGGISGFIKTLGHEFSMKIKHIYSEKVSEILQELEFWDGYIEIAFKDNIRYTLVVSEIDEQSPSSKITVLEEDVVLATGGGRGITFKCVEELCSRVKPKIAIMGIEEISGYDDDFLDLTEDQMQERRSLMIEELKTKEEKVTPVIIERNWNKFLFGLDVLRNIRSLENKGISVIYRTVDVTDKKAVEKAVKDVEKEFQAKISHIIHGAGLEESKQFKKKKFGLSKLIVSVKVEGIWNILNAVDKKNVKRLICFTSIAGRFGNMGQIDYSFANGYLSRLCWKLNQEGLSALACDWTAWGNVGMATRGSIMNILESQGIYPIPLNKGTKVFGDLFLNGTAPEVVVSCGLGPFKKLLETSSKIENNAFPMIQYIEYKDSLFKGDKKITTNTDLYLNDHQIQNVPFFPGVMGIEMFAEVFKLTTSTNPDILENIQFKSAIKLQSTDSKDLYVKYNPTSNVMDLNSEFVSKADSSRRRELEHFSTSIQSSMNKSRRKKTKHLIEESRIALLSKEDIYAVFFHGESFQVLDTLVELSDEIAVAKAKLPGLKLFSQKNKKTVLDPLTIEATLQTAGLYDYIINQHISLPSTIGKLEVFSKNEPEHIISEFISKDSTHSYYNLEAVDKEGMIILRVNRLGLIHTQFPTDVSEEVIKKIGIIKEYWEMNSLLKETQAKIIPINNVIEKFTQTPEEIVGYMQNQEKAAFQKIKNNKRKMEYLSGLIAAKELYSKIEKNPEIFSKTEIRKTAKGQPFIYNLKEKKKSELFISISHSENYALAAVGHEPLGIDIEKIEERNDSFYKEAFTERERSTISNDTELGTIYWTIKEAVSKALGEGLNLSLHDI